MKYVLRLYVTGRSAASMQAVRNLERICREDLNGEYNLRVIDVLEFPQLAEDDKILVTPTLVKLMPSPSKKIIGDLGRRENVLQGLDIFPSTKNNKENNS